MMHIQQINNQSMSELIDRHRGLAMAIEDIITRNEAFLSEGVKRDLNSARAKVLNCIPAYEAAQSRGN